MINTGNHVGPWTFCAILPGIPTGSFQAYMVTSSSSSSSASLSSSSSSASLSSLSSSSASLSSLSSSSSSAASEYIYLSFRSLGALKNLTTDKNKIPCWLPCSCHKTQHPPTKLSKKGYLTLKSLEQSCKKWFVPK